MNADLVFGITLDHDCLSNEKQQTKYIFPIDIGLD